MSSAPTNATNDGGAGADLTPPAAVGGSYAREWALFCDYTTATGQPTLPTTVTALAGFLAQVRGRPATQGRRVAAIAAAHRNTGHLLDCPDLRDPPASESRPSFETLIKACPTRGWPAGFLGRRDGFLIVLTAALHYPHTKARRIQPGDVTLDGDAVWRIGDHKVPTSVDPRSCPTCALVRWLDILGIADGLGRGSARMELSAAHNPTALSPHQHTTIEPQRWRAAAHLLPAIDRHGWIDDYQPLSTRSIRNRLTLAAARAGSGSWVAGDIAAKAGFGADTDTTGPRSESAENIDEVLARLDQVAADADALNIRIQALLTGSAPPPAP